MTDKPAGLITILDTETETEFYLFTFYLRLPKTRRNLKNTWSSIRAVKPQFSKPYDGRFPVREAEVPKELRKVARRNKWRARALAQEIRTQELIAQKTAEDVEMTRTLQLRLLDQQLHNAGRVLGTVWNEVTRRVPNMTDATLVNLLRTLLGQSGQLVRTRALPAGEATDRVEFKGQLAIAHALLGTETVEDILAKVPETLDATAEQSSGPEG